MRISSKLILAGILGMSGAAAIAACGSSVNDSSAAGASGGAKGTSSTTSSAVLASTVAASSVASSAATTGSGGAGGGDVCMQACNHIQTCTGFNACAQVPLDCSQSLYQCVAMCLLPIPCAQISLGSAQDCLATCMQGDGGMPDGGAMACTTCAEQKCSQQSLACGKDMTAKGCAAWLQCAGACETAVPQDPNCVFACDQANPGAAAETAPLYECACTNCSNECGALDPCAHLPDAGGGGAGGG